MDVDFFTGAFNADYSNVVSLPINMASSDVILTPSAFPSGLGIQFFLLLVTFSQEINGVQYPLKNESFNVLQILDVV